MHEYVFLHIDTNGCMWKHVHFSRLAAERARRWWASLKVTKECSCKITERKRRADMPCIQGVNIDSLIPIDER